MQNARRSPAGRSINCQAYNILSYELCGNKGFDVPDSFSGSCDVDEEEGEDVPSCFGEPEGIFCYICRFRKECEMNSIRQAS